jgi:GWxTD domain-containing protein
MCAAFSKGFSDDKIFFNFDYSVFRGEEGKSILEVYYSVNQQSLSYLQSGDGFEAAAVIDIVISDASNGGIIHSNVYKSPLIVTDTTRVANNKKLIGQLNYLLDNGRYKILIRGIDFNDTTRIDVVEQEVLVNIDVTNTKVEFSDIELSTSISKSKNLESPFYKNTLEIIPNPSGLFGMNLSELNYYVEIYGLTPENISEDYIISHSVKDLNDSKVISFSKKMKRKIASKADYGTIKIDSLISGSYVLSIRLEDSSKGISVSKEKKFYIFNNVMQPTTSIEADDFLKSEYSRETEENLDYEFRKILYIINSQQKKRYESLSSLNDKRKFMYEFWKSIDEKPETQVLETKISFMKRVGEANKLFKEAYTEGWKTDRGRVYIKYGKPDDVESFPFETKTKSYSIWKYHSMEGGGECIFIELQHSTGVFRLVHSTFREELKNENWKEQLNIYN